VWHHHAVEACREGKEAWKAVVPSHATVAFALMPFFAGEGKSGHKTQIYFPFSTRIFVADLANYP
jgi:hypothetical protein